MTIGNSSDDDGTVVGTQSQPDEQAADSSEATGVQESEPHEKALADELGIEDLTNPILGGRGRLFSAAGPQAPIVEFTQNHVVMHPPQLPFVEEGPVEDFTLRVDRRGVLLNELGEPKHIAAAKFRGVGLWYAGEQKPGTLKHYAIWFDQHGMPHKLYVNNEPLTTDVIYRLRNKTHDGELSIYPDIKSD